MDVQFLSATPLFQGAQPEAIAAMLDCLGAQTRRYSKGAVILRAGETTAVMGLVLTGRVQIENNDVWGSKSILDSVGQGAVFAETYACVPDEPMMVSAVAAEPSEVLFLHAGRLLHTCPQGCTHHASLIRNLLAISAQKNLSLSCRIFHTSSKTIRGRLLSYLSEQAARAGSADFTIPFDRQQLADYLSVDRSALSNELSKMQRDGLLTVHRRQFHLLHIYASDL